MAETDLIAGYLLELRGALRGFWPQRRRILAEVNDHLCEATERGLAEGLGEREAQARALACFGAAPAVATRFADERLRGATERSLRWMVPAVAAMFVVRALTPLFPIHAAFHWATPQPEVERLCWIGQALAWCALPALALALGLRRRSPRAAWAAQTVLMVCVAIGSANSGLAEMLRSQFSFGDAARLPAWLQVGVSLWVSLSFLPAALAHDAMQATQRALAGR